MASVKFEKGSPEWQMFTDFWALCQKYWKPEETEEYWQCLIDDINSFYKKHRNPFSRNLYMALHKKLEMELKEVGK